MGGAGASLYFSLACLIAFVAPATALAPEARAGQAESAGHGLALGRDQPIDIWVMSGQSNMQGDNGREYAPMPECGTPWPGYIYSFPKMNETEGPQWVHAKPNVARYAATHVVDEESLGPEMAFAKQLIRAGESSVIGLVSVAVGGSSLYRDWSGPTSLLALLFSQVHNAMASLGPLARLRGMVWVHGEADATATAGITNAALYGEHLGDFISIIRREFELYHPQLPVIVAVQATSHRDRVLPYIHLVRHHQLDLDMPAVLKVDMEGYDMLEDNFSEMYGEKIGVQRLHITKAGMCLFGDALARAYLDNREALAMWEAEAAAGGAAEAAPGDAP